MKNTFLTLSAAALFAAAIMVNCKKTDAFVPESNSDEHIQYLLSKTDHFIDQAEIKFEDGILSMENEGLSPDFTVIAANFDEAPVNINAITSDKDESFIDCLRKIELKDDQRIRIKRALERYEDCKASVIKRTREAYNRLLAEHEKRLNRLKRSFLNGYLSKKQYEIAVEKEKLNFKEAVQKLHEKEKKALKDCYNLFLRELKSILTEKQWQLFYECHR
jgi:hypothetical protein